MKLNEIPLQVIAIGPTEYQAIMNDLDKCESGKVRGIQNLLEAKQVHAKQAVLKQAQEAQASEAKSIFDHDAAAKAAIPDPVQEPEVAAAANRRRGKR